MIDRFQEQLQAMQMLSKAQEVTADNLANINTPGFRGSILFHRVLQEQIDGQTVTRTEAMQQINMEQGILEPTGNPFDLGIEGEGFFVVEQDGDSFLTRDGRFHINSDGYLVNSSGGRVSGQAGPVHLPEYFQGLDSQTDRMEVEVGSDGTVRVNDEVMDKIRVVEVDDPSNLERRGNSYFALSEEGTLVEENSSTILQGYFEKGNVNPLNEMVDMMRNMQMFEAQQRILRSNDEILGQATNSLGRF